MGHLSFFQYRDCGQRESARALFTSDGAFGAARRRASRASHLSCRLARSGLQSVRLELELVEFAQPPARAGGWRRRGRLTLADIGGPETVQRARGAMEPTRIVHPGACPETAREGRGPVHHDGARAPARAHLRGARAGRQRGRRGVDAGVDRAPARRAARAAMGQEARRRGVRDHHRVLGRARPQLALRRAPGVAVPEVLAQLPAPKDAVDGRPRARGARARDRDGPPVGRHLPAARVWTLGAGGGCGRAPRPGRPATTELRAPTAATCAASVPRASEHTRRTNPTLRGLQAAAGPTLATQAAPNVRSAPFLVARGAAVAAVRAKRVARAAQGAGGCEPVALGRCERRAGAARRRERRAARSADEEVADPHVRHGRRPPRRRKRSSTRSRGCTGAAERDDARHLDRRAAVPVQSGRAALPLLRATSARVAADVPRAARACCAGRTTSSPA